MIDHATRDAVVAELYAAAREVAGMRGDDAGTFIRMRAERIERGQPSEAGPATDVERLPAWSGTSASARHIGDLAKAIDEYAEVGTDVEPGSYFVGRPVLHLDTVPNRITLHPGDRPVFDGERWSVEKAPEETTS